ncbi:MAG: hypothetical protein WCQ03_04300 [Phycisphaerae bacterium]
MDESALLEDVVFDLRLVFAAGACDGAVGGVAGDDAFDPVSLVEDGADVGVKVGGADCAEVGGAVGGAVCAPTFCAIMKHKKMQGNMWASILTWICAHANRLMNGNFNGKFRHSHRNLNRAAFRVAFPQENHYEIRSHERIIHRPTS